jgi:MFS transporter, PPP family, 3-phenylpropionic acid transporter
MLARVRGAPYIAFYLICLGYQAVMMAFVPLYVEGLGYRPWQIAAISAAENLATIVGPLVLTQSTFGSSFIRDRLARFAVFCFLFAAPILVFKKFWFFLICWLGSLLFSRTVFSLVNQSALDAEKRGQFDFGRVRLWGGVSFVVALAATGKAVELYGLGSVPIIAVSSLAIMIVTCLPRYGLEPEAGPDKVKIPLRDALRLPPAPLWLVLATALVWCSHGPYYTFVSIHLKNLDWSASWIAAAWNIGVVAEIVLFLLFSKLERRLSLVAILNLSSACTAFRWLLLGMTTNWFVILLSQLLHAFSFGGCYLASMKLIGPLLPADRRHLAQALLLALGTGAGSLVGKIFAGAGASLIDRDKGFYPLFTASAAVALGACLAGAQLSRAHKKTGRDTPRF